MNKEEVVNSLKDKPMQRGFYQNAKGTVRYLRGIQEGGDDLFVIYATKPSALRAFKPKSDGMQCRGINTQGSKVFEWFRNAEYLGNTPEHAGLIDSKDVEAESSKRK